MEKDSKHQLKKLEAETDKLSAEADHFRINASFMEFRMILQGIATGAAVFGVLIGAIQTFGGN
jgi:hypothetical protein